MLQTILQAFANVDAKTLVEFTDKYLGSPYGMLAIMRDMPAPTPKEETEKYQRLYLTVSSITLNRLMGIKALRMICDAGLKDSKDFIDEAYEAAGVRRVFRVIPAIPPREVQLVTALLREAGLRAEFEPASELAYQRDGLYPFNAPRTQ